MQWSQRLFIVLPMSFDLKIAWFRCKITTEAHLQVRELERLLRDRWNEMCVGQDVRSPFPADYQLLVAPFMLQIFQNCIWTQSLCWLLLFPAFDQWSYLLIWHTFKIKCQAPVCRDGEAAQSFMTFVLSLKYFLRMKWEEFCTWEEIKTYIGQIQVNVDF